MTAAPDPAAPVEGYPPQAGGEPVRRVLARKAYHIVTIGTMALVTVYAGRAAAAAVFGLIMLALFVAFLTVARLPRGRQREFVATTRRRDKRFPLQGTVFSLLGATGAVLLFPQHVAAAALLVLALGDSVSTIFALRFGRVPFPWAPEIFADAWLVGVAAGAVGAALFLPWWAAIAASALGQVPDATRVREAPLWFDDNLLTPVLAGAAAVILLAG